MKFDDEICKGISCPECSFNKGEDGCLLAKRLDEIEITSEPCEDAVTSAQPERKHGYWIESHEHVYMCNEVKEWTNWYCSECDAPNSWPTDYCPNCGARMEVDDESN